MPMPYKALLMHMPLSNFVMDVVYHLVAITKIINPLSHHPRHVFAIQLNMGSAPNLLVNVSPWLNNILPT